MRRLRILTWHTHGSYLYYLSQLPHDIYVLSKPGRPAGYGGRCGEFPWGANLFDMPVTEVQQHHFDCVIFQDDPHWLQDQYLYLSADQRALPRVYIEHDPPREHPTDTRHVVTDPTVLVVHVTPFNALMWDCGEVPVAVIDHGVQIGPDVHYSGTLARGLVIINQLSSRGRRLGLDIFEHMRSRIPLDLIGMGSEVLGGLGEVRHADLPAFAARYRFLFNPIRYTSMGLAVIEAMQAGVPVAGLATTEMVTAIRNGQSGYVHTRLDEVEASMHRLLADHDLARRLGQGARQYALQRFGIARFVDDWNAALARACALSRRAP